jgi:hypothetical protein
LNSLDLDFLPGLSEKTLTSLAFKKVTGDRRQAAGEKSTKYN